MQIEELQILASELPIAYELAAQNGPNYRPQRKDGLKEEIEHRATTPADSTEQQTKEINTPKTTQLGTVENPFPWASDEALEVSALKAPEGNVLFCEAMSPKARNISDRLRGQKQNRKDFASFWGKVKEIEAGNHASSHNNINRVHFVSSENFDGLTILRYGTVGANARRLYYIKTYAEKYPHIAKMATEQDIDPSTPLLILIAETDKANQIKILGDFGITKSIAKAGNAGSI
jgi:hypothetical protein